MILSIDKILNSVKFQKIYDYMTYLSYVIFTLLFIGVSFVTPQYLTLLENIITYYISFFLIIRFNPLTTKHLKYNKKNIEFQNKVAFSAGIFLLLTTSLVNIAKKYTDYTIIKPVKNKIQSAFE